MSNGNPKTSFDKWNRKIHIYLGLYMILFLWLFAISGLMMNHPKWFGHKVERIPSEQSVEVPDLEDNVAMAKALQAQLGLEGEIILRAQRKKDHFVFMVMRPNVRFAIDVDLKKASAKINRVTPHAAGVIGQMHTFSGVRGMWNEPVQEKDWIVTRLWSLSMDAVCIGLIFMVLSSYYMGFRLKEKRCWVVLSFALGVLVCGYFVWGLTLV